MPRKKTTKAEAEGAAENAAEAIPAEQSAPMEPGDDVPRPRRKAAAKKAPAKKRASRSTKAKEAEGIVVQEAESATAEAPDAAGTEVSAHTADTFEDAFEANDGREARKPEGAAGSAMRIDSKGKQPTQEPAEEPDEGDELEGDWESGSGDQVDEEERPEPPPARQERLQKILAAAGIASRRHAEELITEGRVQVNGQVVTTLGSKADPARDHIRVDGKLIHGAERLRYFMLNKPRGYVTTVSDPEGRPTVMQFFARMGERLYPVGRLDYQSEGLLLMTNDGELANQLTRAASGVEKIYLVKVAGQPDASAIEALREGVRIDRGKPGEGRVHTAPARIRQVRQGENPWYEVALIEGRNRELRKMFEEIGHHVEKIRRVGYGPLELDVEPGKMRELTAEEVQTLRLTAEGKLKPKRPRTSTMLPKEAGRTVDFEARRGGPAGRYQGQRREGGQGQRREGWRERGQGQDRRPQRGVEQPRERRSEGGFGRAEGGDRAHGERGGFAGRGQGQRPWQGQRQDRPQAQRGQWQDRPRAPRPPRTEDQSRGEQGGFVGRTQGQKPWQGQRQDRTGGRQGAWQDRRQGQRAPRSEGQRPPRPPREDHQSREQRPRFEGERTGARQPFREGAGLKPQRFERGGEERREGRGFGGGSRRGFGGESGRGFDRTSRPSRAGGDRGQRGSFTPRPEGERPSTPPRGGKFGKPGGGPRASGGARSEGGARPVGGFKPGGGSRPGGGGRPGGRPFGGGRPGGRGGRKPGGFGKGGPR